MNNMNKLLIIPLILSIVIISGCTSEDQSPATSYKIVPESKEVLLQQRIELFSTAATADVWPQPKNWDADAEDDGIIVYPSLKDINGEPIQFERVTLSVDIEVWTKKMNMDYKKVKDRQIYNGTGMINSWYDGNMFMNGGIRVPFDDMNILESDDYGYVFIRIHTPDGKTYEAESALPFSLKP